jgi:tetratricopeptide (TPR) repeat protein
MVPAPVPVPVPVPAPVPTVAVRAPLAVAVFEPRRSRRHDAPGPRSPDMPVGPTQVLPTEHPALSAGALLASGTAARARGDRAAAVAFFRQLQVAYPAAKESQVALVSSGQLLLDGGDLGGALAAFRAYRERAPAGPLIEEALDGAARALAGLGRHSEERTVWREMVARFPGSAYVPRATQRLRVLR